MAGAEFVYRRVAEQGAAAPVLHPVVVVGAGPVGLSLAIDLAQRLAAGGGRVLLLDGGDCVASGSRAICFAKRTLEIWDRLGVGDRMVGKGVSWHLGRVFGADQPIFSFDLLPEPGHERPAFINLQQYHAERYLCERAAALPNLEIRWRNAVSGLALQALHAELTVDTPDGPYTLRAGYLAACDGSRSTLRSLMGLESKGRVFRDRFLIADVHIDGELFAEGRAERWFWFDPPFHPGAGAQGGRGAPSSVLLHRQPDNLWRVDFQLGWDADPEVEKQPERIVPRVQALLRQGLQRDVPFTLQWASVYTFACQRMEHFRHGRVFFAGDAAHGMSPFGARGANSGVQDAENLAWKLAAVLGGDAPDALLDTYAREREFAADENLRNSTRSTDFITPKSAASRLFRDAVLALARDHPFARKLVNSGRLSVPATLSDTALSTPDVDDFDNALGPGSPAADAPLEATGRATWLLREIGPGFTLLVFGPAPAWSVDCKLLAIDGDRFDDIRGLAGHRYDAEHGTAYLLRPDGHVAARWREPTQNAVRAALARALCRS